MKKHGTPLPCSMRLLSNGSKTVNQIKKVANKDDGRIRTPDCAFYLSGSWCISNKRPVEQVQLQNLLPGKHHHQPTPYVHVAFSWSFSYYTRTIHILYTTKCYDRGAPFFPNTTPHLWSLARSETPIWRQQAQLPR